MTRGAQAADPGLGLLPGAGARRPRTGEKRFPTPGRLESLLGLGPTTLPEADVVEKFPYINRTVTN